MTTTSEHILTHWQVRKTKKQKDAFIAFMQQQFPELRVEQGGLGNNKNLILGDIPSARVIFTAHYDTCARMPVPNFLTPKNFFVYLIYVLLLCIPTFFAYLVVSTLLALVIDNYTLIDCISYLFAMGSLLMVLAGGPPNPHTANDNTSGVITLCELYQSLSPEERSKAAFVFFDNEENGLLGSAFFAVKHRKEQLGQKLVVNFDCVSDGNHYLLVQSKSAARKWGNRLAAAFSASEGRHIHLEKAATTMYPSDQMNFPMSVGVAVMKYKRGIGMYINRIHTARDTVFQKDNIDYLVSSSKMLLSIAPSKEVHATYES